MKNTLILIIISFLTYSCKDNIIGVNYELDYDPSHEIFLINKQKSESGSNLIKIQGHILYYGYSENYVVAIQKPADSICHIEENLPYQKRMAKIFKSNFSQFWILRVKDDSLFGPYQKDKYLKMRAKIGVPTNLNIDHSTLSFYENDYREDIQYKNPDLEVVKLLKNVENK